MTEGLRPVASEDWQSGPLGTTKTMYLPLASPQIAASLMEQGHGPEDVLPLHYCPRQGTVLRTLDRVSPVHIVQAYNSLLASHPLYQGVNMNQHLRGLREMVEDLMRTGSVSKDLQTLPTMFSVVVPDQPGSSPEARQLLAVGSAQLAALYDPRGEAMMEQEGREVAITPKEYWMQRLHSCHREGPGDRPGLVLARVLQFVQQQRELAGEARMMDILGSRGFLKKQKTEISGLVRWNGGPILFITCTQPTPSTCDLALSTWVSHEAGVRGKSEQVWHVESERELLNFLPGKAVNPDGGLFFVHSRINMREGSCPYHNFCDRTPVEEWRHR